MRQVYVKSSEAITKLNEASSRVVSSAVHRSIGNKAEHYVLEVPDLEKHIIARSHRRAIGEQFSLGVVSAARALAKASLKDDEIRDTAIYAASRSGERDADVDLEMHELADRGELTQGVINKLLMTRLRPTLFLTQIPNLLAANISILYKLLGESRTFLGEETGGATALSAAILGVGVQKFDNVLTGSAFVSNRQDQLDWFASYPRTSNSRSCNSNYPRILGSSSAFAVLGADPSESDTPRICIQELTSTRFASEKAESEFLERLKTSIESDENEAILVCNIASSNLKDFCQNNRVRMLETSKHCGRGLEVDAALGLHIASCLLRRNPLEGFEDFQSLNFSAVHLVIGSENGDHFAFRLDSDAE